MKKFLSIALVIVMMMTMSVTAFATSGSDSATQDNYSSVITVNGTVTDRSGNDIMVFVSWGDMSFEYIKNDYDNYTGEYKSYWNETKEGGIVIKNFSNVAVTCDFSFSSDTWEGGFNFEGVDERLGSTESNVTWSEGVTSCTINAPTSEDISAETWPTACVKVTVNDASAAIDSDVELGTITIYISSVSQ